jgi:4a-hydroxytetrahydrobiopterin dehydratase
MPPNAPIFHPSVPDHGTANRRRAEAERRRFTVYAPAMSGLTEKRCVPCEGGVPALSWDEIGKLVAQVPEWQISSDNKSISRSYEFKNYYETMAFVNAIAWMAHREDHHPDLEVGYKTCLVRYATHAIGGLSENDFICAAKVDALLAR